MKTLIVALGMAASLALAAASTGCGGREIPIGKSQDPIEKGGTGDDDPCPISACQPMAVACVVGQTAFNIRCERDKETGTCQSRNDCATFEDGCTAEDCASSPYGCDGGYIQNLVCGRGTDASSGTCRHTFECLTP